MKILYLLIAITIISFCIVSVNPSYSLCIGTFQPGIQKDNGMDAEGYHTYLASINDNQTYPIKYKISSGAVIEAMSSETQSTLSIIVWETPQGGNLTIQLPTKLLGLYSEGGYSVSEGVRCAAMIGEGFPPPIESNLNFTTVEFPLTSHDSGEKMIYIMGNYQQPSTTELPSPLKQFKSGITANDVKCKQGLQLVIKTGDNSPACVKLYTAKILVERNWGMNISQYGSNPTLTNNLHLTNSNFSVNYSITGGHVLGVKLDSQSKAVMISIHTTGNGQLIIDLPRALIDAKFNNIQDEKFYVLNNGKEADFQETDTTKTDRILAIPFIDGTAEIEIIGTHSL